MSLATERDARLIRRIAQGDHCALSELFDRHSRPITRYAWALAESRADTEELAQDTFVTIWRGAGRLPVETSALPSLLVTCRDHSRRGVVQEKNSDFEFADQHVTASKDEPAYIVTPEKSDTAAAHKSCTLRTLSPKKSDSQPSGRSRQLRNPRAAGTSGAGVARGRLQAARCLRSSAVHRRSRLQSAPQESATRISQR